ncbi:hypothetical protein ACWGDT_25335 [Streptomyces avermitilis]
MNRGTASGTSDDRMATARRKSRTSHKEKILLLFGDNEEVCEYTDSKTDDIVHEHGGLHLAKTDVLGPADKGEAGETTTVAVAVAVESVA